MKLRNMHRMTSLLAGLVDFVMDHASFANLLRLLIRGCPSSGSCGFRERDPKVGRKIIVKICSKFLDGEYWVATQARHLILITEINVRLFVMNLCGLSMQ